MSTKVSNIEAARIYRPVALGQVKDELEAWATAMVHICTGVNLLSPFVPRRLLWRA